MIEPLNEDKLQGYAATGQYYIFATAIIKVLNQIIEHINRLERI